MFLMLRRAWWREYDRLDDFGRFLLVVVTFLSFPLVLVISIVAVHQ
jgi:hypothetical protein